MEEAKMTDLNIVVIGGSAGSLDALLPILPMIKSNFPAAMVIVLHRKNNSGSPLTQLIAAKANLPVAEVEEKQPVLPGRIYLAPADYHLLIENDLSFSLDYSEKVHYSRPSIDVCFESVAEVFKQKTTGVLLSGANADGVAGLKCIRAHGGMTIVQDPATAEVSYMPDEAIRQGVADYIFTPAQIADYLNGL